MNEKEKINFSILKVKKVEQSTLVRFIDIKNYNSLEDAATENSV